MREPAASINADRERSLCTCGAADGRGNGIFC
jgi:hypothetical protein